MGISKYRDLVLDTESANNDEEGLPFESVAAETGPASDTCVGPLALRDS